MVRLLLLCAMLLAPMVAESATYYVRKTGSNSNSCATATSSSPTAAKLSINAGIGCMASGDTLIVGGGTYNECISDGVTAGTTPIPPGTSWDNATTIQSATGETVWLQTPQCPGGAGRIETDLSTSKYMIFDGLNITGNGHTLGGYAIATGPNASYIRFQNIEIKEINQVAIFHDAEFCEYRNIHCHHIGLPGPVVGNGVHCFYVTGMNNLITHSRIHHNNCMGIQFSDEGGTVRYNTVQFSEIHNNGCLGVMAFPYNYVYNNLIYENEAGVKLNSGAKAHYNVVYNNGDIGLWPNGSGIELKNNIVLGQQWDILDQDTGSVDFASNICTAVGASGTIGCTMAASAASLFRDVGTYDFHLRAGASAIGAGVSLASLGLTVDKDGVPRPATAPDIGAYQFLTQGTIIVEPAALALSHTCETSLNSLNAAIYGSLFYLPSSAHTDTSALVQSRCASQVALTEVASIITGAFPVTRPFEFSGALGPNVSNTCTNCLAVHAGLPSNNAAGSGFTMTNFREGASLSAALAGSGHSSIWTLMPGLCKEVVNGVTTATGLWRWKMDQRISDALVAAGKPAMSVTAAMEAQFGTIPAECLASGDETCVPPHIGTPPNCTCPAGTVEPLCEPPICPPDCPAQSVFWNAPASASPPGNDANACTLAAPCLTINYTRTLMTPGDTLYLQPGTYTGSGNRIITSTGPFPAGNDWTNPTRIAAYAGGVVLQQSSETVITLNNPTTDRYLVFDGLTCDGASSPTNDTACINMTSGVHHIRVQNSTLRNTHFRIMQLSGVNNIDILNSTFHGATHSNEAIQVTGGSNTILLDGVTLHSNNANGLAVLGGGITNVTVRNSTSRNNGGTGFLLGGANLLATNLLAYGNAVGVNLTSLTVDGRLYNATVADNSGVEVQIDAGATDTLLTNVLAVGGITNNGTGTVLTTNYTGDPGFVGGGNYRLALAASPAADTGTCLPGVVDVALDGIARPQPTGGACDIGAYERSGSGDPPLPTPGALSARPYGSRLLILPQ